MNEKEFKDVVKLCIDRIQDTINEPKYENSEYRDGVYFTLGILDVIRDSYKHFKEMNLI